MSVLSISLNIFNKLTVNFPPASSAEGDEQRRCGQDVPGVGKTEIPGAAGQVQTPAGGLAVIRICLPGQKH